MASFDNTKNLRFEVRLGLAGSSFTSDGKSNTVILNGLRSSVHVENAGGAYMGRLRAQIYGLQESDLNSLTSLLWDSSFVAPPGTQFAYNDILVTAIDGSQQTVVFNGQVLNAWGVFASMPETYLLVDAILGYNSLVSSTTPISVGANTDVGTLMGTIAAKMGFNFKNDGVNIPVSKGTYLGSTPMEQARTLVQSYRFWMYMTPGDPNTLTIVPNGKAVSTSFPAPLISPETGLIGYPAFSGTGVNFETLFNPGIVFGAQVEISSSLPKARGKWTVISMSHDLSCQTPDGPWKSTVNTVSSNFGAQIVGSR